MNKKLISMFLLPAALVACNNDDLTADFEQENAKEVVEGLTLSVGLDANAQTRGQYAGSTETSGAKVFQNFYLEPETASGTGVLQLSNNTTLKGDMLGFCLTNSGNAITNLPFYIAGYGSTKATTPGAKTTIFTFDNQTSGNALYNLGLDNTTQAEDKVLWNGGSVNAAAKIATSATAIATVAADANLGADAMDVRKGIVRTNAGVMTGNYVAYYPYNANFTEPGAIPVPNLDGIQNSGSLAVSQAAAVTKNTFYNKFFAMSKTPVSVKGGTKSGDVSLSPVTGAAVFRIFNTGDAVSKEIKLITVEAADGSFSFPLEGTVDPTSGKFTATKSTNILGVSFTAATVAAGKTQANAVYIVRPCYGNTDGKVKVSVYTTDGKKAEVEKDFAPMGAASTVYNIDLGVMTWTDTERYVYDKASFLAEIGTEGTLVMLSDITVDADVTIAASKPITIKGNNHVLKLTGGSQTTKINAALTMQNGTLELGQNTTTVAAAVSADKLVVNANVDAGTHKLTANEVEVKALKTLTVQDAVITTLNNAGKFVPEGSTASPATSVVNVTTLNNDGTLTLVATMALDVTTLNVNKGSVADIAGKLTVTDINIAAGTTTPSVADGKVTVAATGTVSKANVTNNGDFDWNAADMNLTVTNNGEMNLKAAGKVTGSIENNSKLTEAAVTISVESTITNKGTFTVNGSLIVSTGKLNITSGVVENKGTISGAANITVTEGAEFVCSVNSPAKMTTALGSGTVAAKYTGIRVAGGVTMANAVSTTKKIYLNANLVLPTDAVSALNGDVVVGAASTTLIGNANVSKITVNSASALTIGGGSNIIVAGKIVNNGTFSITNGSYVECQGVETGAGATWNDWPAF